MALENLDRIVIGVSGSRESQGTKLVWNYLETEENQEFLHKHLLISGKTTEVQIAFDLGLTESEEIFNPIRLGHGVILCFSFSSADSFRFVTSKIRKIKQFQELEASKLAIFIVGIYSSLDHQNSPPLYESEYIPREVAENFALSVGAEFLVCDIQSLASVNEIFDSVIGKVHKIHKAPKIIQKRKNFYFRILMRK